ncbi:MAG: hypothetical protein ACMZ63_06530 [Methylotenera sp.]
MVKKLIFAILLLQLSSCVVLHQEYFYPEAKGAKAEKPSCRGKVGPDNQLVFKIDDVIINLDVWEHKETTYLGISFTVHQNAQVIWPDQVVVLHIENSIKNLKVRSFNRLRVFVNEHQESDLLKKEYSVGSIMNRTTEKEFESYYESFIVSDKSISELKIDKIKLIVNGEEHVLSDIEFTKTSGLFLHPLNC